MENLNAGVFSLRGSNAAEYIVNFFVEVITDTAFYLPDINTAIIHSRHKLGSRKKQACRSAKRAKTMFTDRINTLSLLGSRSLRSVQTQREIKIAKYRH